MSQIPSNELLVAQMLRQRAQARERLRQQRANPVQNVVTYQPIAAPPIPDPGGAFTSFAESAAESVVPFAGGIAGAKGGATAGAAIGTAITPGIGTVIGGIGGALVGGIAGSVAASGAQEVALTALLGEERRRRQAERRAAQREAHPVATFLGETAPFLATFRPSLQNLRRAGSAVMNLRTAAGRAQLARRPAEIAVAGDVIGGTAVGVGAEAYRQAQEGRFSGFRLAAEGAMGAVFTEPNRLGRAAGIAPTPTRREDTVRRVLERIDRRRRESGRAKLTDAERSNVVRETMRRIAAVEAGPTQQGPAPDPIAQPPLPTPDQIGQPRLPSWRVKGEQARNTLRQAQTNIELMQREAEQRIRDIQVREQEALAKLRQREPIREVARIDPDPDQAPVERTPAQAARQSERALRDAEAAIRERISREAMERLPEELRGQLVQTIARARTPAQMEAGLRRIERVLARHTARTERAAIIEQNIAAAREAAHDAVGQLPSAFRQQAQRIIDRTSDPNVMLRAAQKAIDTYERNNAIDVVHRLLNQERRRRERGESLTPDAIQIIRDAAGDIDPKPLTKTERKSLSSTLRHMRRTGNALVPKSVVDNIHRLTKRDIRTLSTDELLAVADSIRTARHVSRTQLKFLNQLQEGKVNTYSKAIERDLNRKAPATSGRVQRTIERVFGHAAKSPQARSTGQWLKQAFIRPEAVLEEMSPRLRTLVYDRIGVEGHDQYIRTRDTIRSAMIETFRRAGMPMGTKEFRLWQNQKVATGSLGEITRSERIGLATMLRDPDNLEVAVSNGLSIRSQNDRRVSITREEATAIARGDGLDPVELAAVDHMFSQYNSTIPEILNAAWRREYGVDIATRTDYAPRTIESPRFNLKDPPGDSLSKFREGALTAWSHTQRRVGTSEPIMVANGIDTYLNHVDFVSRISAYLTPTNDALKVLTRTGVKDAITSRYGNSGYERILDAIRLQTMPVGDISNAERRFRRAMRFYATGVLGLRMSTMLLNPSGLFTAAPYMGWDNMAKAMRSAINPREHARIAQTASQYSAYYNERYGRNYSREAFAGMIDNPERNYGEPTIGELAMEPIKWSDQFGGNIRWAAAEHFVAQRNPNIEQGSDEFYRLVAREWEKSMYRSENTGHGMELSGALAAARRNPALIPFVIFQSSTSKIISGAVTGIDHIRKGNVQQGISHLAGYMGSIVFAFAVREMLREGRGTMDDEDRKLGARGARLLAESVSQIPIFGEQVFAPLARHIAGSRIWTNQPAVFDMLADTTIAIADAINGLSAAYQQEVDRYGQSVAQQRFARAMEMAVSVGSRVVGYPYDGAKDSVRILNNITSGLPRKNRKDIHDFVTKEVNELARQDGRLTSNDTTASKANNQIFKALRNHQPGGNVDANTMRWFETGIRRRMEAGLPVDRNTLRSMIHGRYAMHSRIVDDPEQFNRLSEDAQSALMVMIQDRDMLLEAIDDLIASMPTQ